MEFQHICKPTSVSSHSHASPVRIKIENSQNSDCLVTRETCLNVSDTRSKSSESSQDGFKIVQTPDFKHMMQSHLSMLSQRTRYTCTPRLLVKNISDELESWKCQPAELRDLSEQTPGREYSEDTASAVIQGKTDGSNTEVTKGNIQIVMGGNSEVVVEARGTGVIKEGNIVDNDCASTDNVLEKKLVHNPLTSVKQNMTHTAVIACGEESTDPEFEQLFVIEKVETLPKDSFILEENSREEEL